MIAYAVYASLAICALLLPLAVVSAWYVAGKLLDDEEDL